MITVMPAHESFDSSLSPYQQRPIRHLIDEFDESIVKITNSGRWPVTYIGDVVNNARNSSLLQGGDLRHIATCFLVHRSEPFVSSVLSIVDF